MNSIRLFLFAFTMGVGIWIIYLADRTAFSFSFFGYSMAAISQLLLYLQNSSTSWNTPKFTRFTAIFRQISWTSNVLISIVFWSYLYNHPIIRPLLTSTFTMHCLMVWMHSAPIVYEIFDMLHTGNSYQKGDYKYTIFYLLSYGVVNILDALYYGVALYPMLKWNDKLSAIFIAITILLTFSVHSLGSYVSKKIHSKSD